MNLNLIDYFEKTMYSSYLLTLRHFLGISNLSQPPKIPKMAALINPLNLLFNRVYMYVQQQLAPTI